MAAFRNALFLILTTLLGACCFGETIWAQEQEGVGGTPRVQIRTDAPSTSADGNAQPVSPDASFSTKLLEMLRALHYWVIPFALATFVAIWFTAERLVVLRRGRVIPKPFVRKFLKLIEDGELDKHEALEICEENGSPVALVFAHGVRKWGKPSVEVEQAIIDGGEREVSGLRTHLRVLNGVATITPLLGLLGTVWGMLESFNKIAYSGAMGRINELASGIALALVTTAAGLVIAIPCLVVYMYFSSRVDSLVMEMDALAQRLVHAISAEGLADRASRPRKSVRSAGDTAPKKAV